MTVHLLWTYWSGKEELQVSLKIADEVMEEIFIWIQGRNPQKIMSCRSSHSLSKKRWKHCGVLSRI